MKIIALGISEPDNDYVHIWGLDLDTYCVVKVLCEKKPAALFRLYRVFEVEAQTVGNGLPVFLLKDIKSMQDFDADIEMLLDLAASNIASILKLDDYGMTIAKVSRCWDINVGKNTAELVVSFAGIGEKKDILSISDWHWHAYWENQNENVNTCGLCNYINSCKPYMILEHKENAPEGMKNCAALIVI